MVPGIKTQAPKEIVYTEISPGNGNAANTWRDGKFFSRLVKGRKAEIDKTVPPIPLVPSSIDRSTSLPHLQRSSQQAPAPAPQVPQATFHLRPTPNFHANYNFRVGASLAETMTSMDDEEVNVALAAGGAQRNASAADAGNPGALKGLSNALSPTRSRIPGLQATNSTRLRVSENGGKGATIDELLTRISQNGGGGERGRVSGNGDASLIQAGMKAKRTSTNSNAPNTLDSKKSTHPPLQHQTSLSLISSVKQGDRLTKGVGRLSGGLPNARVSGGQVLEVGPSIEPLVSCTCRTQICKSGGSLYVSHLLMHRNVTPTHAETADSGCQHTQSAGPCRIRKPCHTRTQPLHPLTWSRSEYRLGRCK